MTWYVKSRNDDGSINPILCDEREQVAENYRDQVARGRPVTIEDVQGRIVDPSHFGIEDAG